MQIGAQRVVIMCLVVSLIEAGVALSTPAGAQTTAPGAPEPIAQERKSMGDVAKQLSNPVADLGALNFQFKRYYLQGEATDRTREQDVMNFRPVLPIHLTKEWWCIRMISGSTGVCVSRSYRYCPHCSGARCSDIGRF